MHQKHTYFICILFGFITAILNAQELDSLISRIDRRQATYDLECDYTCLVVTRQHAMDKHWTPKKTMVIEKQITKNQGNTTVNIISAKEYRKGKEKDITDEMKKEIVKNREKEEKKQAEENQENKRELKLGLHDLIPFGKEQRNQFTFLMLPDTFINTHRYYRIQTRALEPSRDRYEGSYWIDPDTYAITYVELLPSQNPKFVKEMQMKFWFEEMGSNHWLPVKTWSRVFAGILIKKMRIQIEDVYSNYQF